MAQRLTYRRRCSYNTRSNRVKAVKTPGKPQNKIVEKELKSLIIKLRWKTRLPLPEEACQGSPLR
jgi:hypothetical protein